MSVYGEWCPKCAAEIVSVTRGIPSMGTCKNGHMTDRRDTLRREPVPVAADLSQAAVAAALEAAAAHCKQVVEDCKKYNLPQAAGMVASVGREIRALITPSQHDALAAHVAAEVAKARAEIYAQIEAMPRREELLGGQRTEYVQLHEALAWIGAKP